MLDKFSRRITYLRVSVTDRCNLRCVYCMPEEGVILKKHEDILSFEEIAEIVGVAATLGITKVRITGGEPLVRRGIVGLVGMLRRFENLREIAMTTNATLLSPIAGELKDAGLDRINISLDTLDADKYAHITRGGLIADALTGINAALDVGLPVKINMVLSHEYSEPDDEVLKMRRFCESRGIDLQLIRQYSLTDPKVDTADYDRPPPCSECNKLRLLADGKLKPCLHSNVEIPVRMDDIEGSLKEAIFGKPARGWVCTDRDMMRIGG